MQSQQLVVYPNSFLQVGEGIFHNFTTHLFTGLPVLDFKTRYFSRSQYVLNEEEVAIPVEMDPWGTPKKICMGQD